MTTSNQLTPGMIINLDGKLYKVESSVKVTVPKREPFIKAKLLELTLQKSVEKNFQMNQSIKDVSLVHRQLEFLYPEGKDYLFLDIENLEQVLVPAKIIHMQVQYLKEGVEVSASFYGDTLFSIELPQFLELMITKIEGEEEAVSNSHKNATLETGAVVKVPSFIEVGDVIKVDTRTKDYVQRV